LLAGWVFYLEVFEGSQKGQKLRVHLMYRPLITMTSNYVVIKWCHFALGGGKVLIKGLEIAVILKEGDAQYWLSNCIYPVRGRTYNAFPEPEKKREEFS